jgi:hypothetical protein
MAFTFSKEASVQENPQHFISLYYALRQYEPRRANIALRTAEHLLGSDHPTIREIKRR